MTYQRAFLSCSIVVVLGLALSAGGCANGGSEGPPADDEGGTEAAATDGPATDATSDAAACSSPKTKCGTVCTSTTNDPKNCGKCGVACGANQVCNASACSYSCAPPDTLCNAPPEGGTPEASTEAGGGDSGGAKDGSGAGEGGGAGDGGGGGNDASGGTDAASSGDAATGDGGSAAPYCANLNTDNGNCGACGRACTGEHTCNGSGQCGLSCGAGQKACVAGDTCIANGTCCSSADCSVTGEVCPQPGGTCQCPGGETVCNPAGSQFNSCISSSYCCTNTDCAAVAGATCPQPGQPCQCANGQKACQSTKSCIPTTSCCTAAGECCDDANGKSCGASTVIGALSLGGAAVTASGLITATGQEDWLTVTFNNNTNLAFHGHIKFTSNPNNEFVFDVAGDCKGTLLSCGEGGLCQGKTEWEEYYVASQGDPTGQTWAAINIGIVYIKVYRAAGEGLTCDQWTLSVTE
jgi:hypothetical protein